MIKIRRMQVDDINKIMQIEEELFNQDMLWSKDSFLSELADIDSKVYFVALIDEKIVAYAGMWLILEQGHITNIAVSTDFQRMGIASLLLKSLYNISFNKSIKSLTLEVNVNNQKAQQLYLKHGFLLEGIRKEYYQSSNEDALIMWKYLV